MYIEHMDYPELDKIIDIDAICFNRVKKKTRYRMEELFYISNEGAFVGKENGEIIAFLFTHTYGKYSVIGPLGVVNEKSGQGNGKQIIRHAITYLKTKGVEKINIEVLPDISKNIGLYLKLGFQFEKPTLQIAIVDNHFQDERNIICGDQIDRGLVLSFLIKIYEETNGFSFNNDVNRVFEVDPSCLFFYLYKNEVVGFLGYYEKLYDYAFGYFEPCCKKDTILSLYKSLCKKCQRDDLSIRVNSSNYMFLSKLKDSIKIEKVIERMIYSDKSKEDETFIIRSFVG